MRAAALCAALCLGCGVDPVDAPPSEARPAVEDVALVDAAAWVASAADPFPSHRPDEVRCAAVGWAVEGGALEIDTGACSYVSVEQPIRAAVPQGTPIVVRLWHQVLHADAPATGHVALAVDGHILWEYTAPIPGAGAIVEATIAAPRDLVAGEAIHLHLHNHGANTWNLGAVFAALPAP